MQKKQQTPSSQTPTKTPDKIELLLDLVPKPPTNPWFVSKTLNYVNDSCQKPLTLPSPITFEFIRKLTPIALSICTLLAIILAITQLPTPSNTTSPNTSLNAPSPFLDEEIISNLDIYLDHFEQEIWMFASTK
ncbi:MAG: hypothetical protein N2035_03120 [Chthoniobacterales bacterium]|nr:hypothetical protein [Chthoniobacterales bacterium]